MKKNNTDKEIDKELTEFVNEGRNSGYLSVEESSREAIFETFRKEQRKRKIGV